MDVHGIILAGGAGQRLGNLSKADLRIQGQRLLDLVVAATVPLVTGRLVVVAPATVTVATGVGQTLENPPLGGPLAGIDAGLRWLEQATQPGPDDLVVVLAVDTPAAQRLLPDLVAAARRTDGDGAVVVGGEPAPFVQHLQACYRFRALSQVIAAAGPPRGLGVRRVLRRLRLVEIPQPAAVCRDLDTTADLTYWQAGIG